MTIDGMWTLSLFCVFLVLPATPWAEDAESENCSSPWEVTVEKNLCITWTGDDRDALVKLEVNRNYTGSLNCAGPKNVQFQFKMGSFCFKTPCPNTKYHVIATLTCNDFIDIKTEEVWTQPSAPEHVSVKTATNTSLLAVWEPPYGPVVLYKVRVNQTDYETPKTFMLISPLNPNTEYNIAVSAKNEFHWGNWSEAVVGKTEIGVPLPPDNVMEIGVTNTSIHIKWTESSPKRGHIMGYTVRWSNLDIQNPQSKNTTLLTYLIEGLDAYTNYSVQVSAWTEAGQGDWSDPLILQTSVGVPLCPELTEGVATSESISLKWKEPSPPKGPILQYAVEWKNLNTGAVQIDITTEEYYIIDNLDPYTNYSIQLRAATKAGESQCPEYFTIRTSAGVPLCPELTEAVPSSESISLKWKEPSPFKGPILQYVIEWKNLNTGAVQIENTTQEYYLIDNLDPYTNYSIEIRAATDAGESECTDAFTIRTSAGVPLPPENIKYMATNTSIALKWEEPKPFRGPILSYTVEWRNMNDNAILWANTSKSYFTIDGLDPYTKYLIRVQASTKTGPGNWSDEVVVRTNAGDPFPPENIKHRTTNISISLEWEEPKVFRGPIRWYTVQWENTNSNALLSANTTDLSYVISGLEPYTNYSVCLKGNTDTGAGTWSDELILQTDIGVALPPKNIIHKESNISIALSWDEPKPSRGPILWYAVHWRNTSTKAASTVNVSETFHTIGKLDPYTNYSIQIQANTEVGNGMWSEELNVRTDIGVPSLPMNIREKVTTNTTINVEWDEPEPFKGPILSYTILWTNLNSKTTETSDTNGSYYVIENLDPFTYYSIQVRARTKAGTGDWSDALRIRTTVGVPLPPTTLEEKKVTNTTIEVLWQEPKPSKGPVLSYTVQWINLKSKKTFSQSMQVLGYVITDLDPYTNYSIKVQAKSQAGPGKWSKELIVETKIGVPLTPKNLEEKHVTNSSIKVEWKEPEPSRGPILFYTIEWINLNNDNGFTNSTDKLSYVIENLKPFTNYSVRVCARTTAGQGEWTTAIIIRTEIGVPLPPENFKKVVATNHTVELEWSEPKKSMGPILLYTVRWTNLISKVSGSGNTSGFSYVVKDLTPFTNYSFRVKGHTEAGEGEWSDVLIAATEIGIPSAPRNVTEQRKTATSIKLSWRQPEPVNGPLVSYKVFWGPKGKKAFTTQLQSSTFEAVDLRPYTEYSFDVAASTDAGWGPWSSTLTVCTDIAAPSAPLNLTKLSSTSTSIMVTWLSPEYPNGPLLEYIIKWDRVPANQATRFSESNSSSYQIVDLDPYTNYSVQIAAQTKIGHGAWSDVLLVWTEIGVPGRALLRSINAESSRRVSVEWINQGPYPGPTHFTLQAWKRPGLCEYGNKDSLVVETKGLEGRQEWSGHRRETVNGLTPFTRYFFRLLLSTDVGERASSDSTEIKTPPDVAGAPTDLQADCDKSTETQLFWKPPKHPNGKIISYLVEYGAENSVWNEELLEVNDMCKGQSVHLRGLRPERPYKISVRARVEDVSEDGKPASLPDKCILPAGVPPLGNAELIKAMGSGPHQLAFEWSRETFSDAMGSLRYYAVIVGVFEALGNATSGKNPNSFPTWFNFSAKLSDVYQATPPQWNPFIEGLQDPLKCSTFIEKNDEENRSMLRCTLGLNSQCSKNESYCNGPLEPDTAYGLKLRAFTRGGFAETQPLAVRTGSLPRSSLVGGLVTAFFVVLLIIAFIGGALVVRKKGGLQPLREALQHRFAKRLPPLPPQPPCAPPEPVLQLDTYLMAGPLTAHNFAEHVRIMMSDSHLRFSEEFETLKRNSPQHPCTTAEMDENRPKNRWLNIFPFDHSRVKLLPLGDEPGSDFVNANYIPGCSCLREYIASQGPLPGTVDDFWRMVWEQSVNMIVMLTQCVERGKSKCEQYWPAPGEAKHYGDVQVRTISESMLSSYVIRVFHVQLGSRERRIKQMHFTHWPDFGCPERPDDLINFVRAVRDHLPRVRPGPILVHCSAGVGRTGTFITVDKLAQQLKSSDSIDVYGTVLELRQYRTNMVQTEDQYIYIHLCVRQLVEERSENHEEMCEEAIYSNLGVQIDTGV